MSENYCPSCDAVLPSIAINIEEGVALCPICRTLSRLSDVVEYERPTEEVVNDPPPGCTLTNEIDATVIRISLRSFSGFIAMLFFSLFWNGITGVFVLTAIAGLYSNLVGQVPAWFPAPPMNGNSAMGLGMTLFLCIFLIPFVAIGLLMIGAVFTNLVGSTVVSVGRDTAWVRTGVGPIGRTHRFDPRSLRSVGPSESKGRPNGPRKELIQIDADKTIRFGSGMSEAKRDWLIAVLRRLLKNANA
ncbi:MAG: hypothetical protein AB8C95_07910 [Phycisphaeraceae bacterium]